MGNERTNDTEKELHCLLYWSLLLCCCWCCSNQLLSRSRFCRLFFPSLISVIRFVSQSVRLFPSCFVELNDWSFKERRHVANKLYCFRKAKPAKCYWNPNKCTDAFKCTMHICTAESSEKSYFTYLILALLVFGLGLVLRLFYTLKCVAFFIRYFVSFWAAVLNAILVSSINS